MARLPFFERADKNQGGMTDRACCFCRLRQWSQATVVRAFGLYLHTPVFYRPKPISSAIQVSNFAIKRNLFCMVGFVVRSGKGPTNRPGCPGSKKIDFFTN
jgi:hypothetical protein